MSRIKFADVCSISLGIALIGLLLPLNLSNIALGIFLLVSIVSIFKEKRKIPSKKQLLFAGFFLLFPLALIYTDDVSYGLKNVERNIVWFIIPILVPFALKMDKKSQFKALSIFSVAIHLLIAFLVLVAFWRYFDSKDEMVFYYSELTDIINFHPVYLSVYFLFGLIILFESWKKKYWNPSLAIKILIVAIDMVFLILLSSKIVLVSFLLVLLISILRRKQSRKKAIFSIVGLFMIVFIIMQFSVTRDRINNSLFSSWELLDKERFEYDDPFTGVTLRLVAWKFVSKKFIENENVFIGVGTGDARDFINRVYKDRNMDAAGYTNFNMHNQYFDYILKFGLIGLLYFLTILFLSFKKAIKEQNGLYFSFLLIFCIFSITESNLEVQRGIVFFVLINTIFYFFPSQTVEQINE